MLVFWNILVCRRIGCFFILNCLLLLLYIFLIGLPGMFSLFPSISDFSYRDDISSSILEVGLATCLVILTASDKACDSMDMNNL